MIGFGVSLDTTQRTVQALAATGLPEIGATVSSDNFDNIRNFIRVSPSNKDEISVALSYIKSRYTRAVLVEDENGADIYDSTVVAGLERFPDARHQIVSKETYDTTNRDKAASAELAATYEREVENRISQMTTNICGAQPATVLFAGRARDLSNLVGDLRDRPCRTSRSR